MYDYISIYPDKTYSRTISAEDLETCLISSLNFTKESHLKFSKMMNGETISLTGIRANAQGGYAFDTLDKIQEINLIEIDVPVNTDEVLEEELRLLAYAIASHFSWLVDERE